MREEGGVPDYPDPEPDENGHLQLAPPTGGLNPEALQDGIGECQSYLEGVVNFSGEDQTALRDAQPDFARCLRKEGIDVADPDPNQTGPTAPPPRTAPCGPAAPAPTYANSNAT
jgi:hypothetical protein